MNSKSPYSSRLRSFHTHEWGGQVQKQWVPFSPWVSHLPASYSRDSLPPRSLPTWVATRGGYKTADMERCQGEVLKIIAAIWLARSTRGRERFRQSLNKAQCIQILRFCSINSARDLPGDPVAKTLLPRERTQVQIPGGGTRFCMQDSAAKLKKKKTVPKWRHFFLSTSPPTRSLQNPDDTVMGNSFWA